VDINALFVGTPYTKLWVRDVSLSSGRHATPPIKVGPPFIIDFIRHSTYRRPRPNSSFSLSLSLSLSTDTHIYGHAIPVSHSISIPDFITLHYYVIHILKIPLCVYRHTITRDIIHYVSTVTMPHSLPSYGHNPVSSHASLSLHTSFQNERSPDILRRHTTTSTNPHYDRIHYGRHAPVSSTCVVKAHGASLSLPELLAIIYAMSVCNRRLSLSYTENRRL